MTCIDVELYVAHITLFRSVTYGEVFTPDTVGPVSHIQGHYYELGTLDTTGHPAEYIVKVRVVPYAH